MVENQNRELNDFDSRPAQMALPESGLLVKVLHHRWLHPWEQSFSGSEARRN